MRQISMAHLRVQGINVAIFDADATSRTRDDRRAVLADLTDNARNAGLRVEKAALAFVESGRLTFFGTPDLVDYLSNGWRPQWTHILSV